MAVCTVETKPGALREKTFWHERPRAKILCIDDDPNVADALARRLRAYGIQVVPAYFGMQGYWLAVTEKPDVILLDLAMPKGSGEEVLECLKRNVQTADIPVAVISGVQQTGIDRHVYKLGADAFLAKPVEIEVLLELISRWIDLLE